MKDKLKYIIVILLIGLLVFGYFLAKNAGEQITEVTIKADSIGDVIYEDDDITVKVKGFAIVDVSAADIDQYPNVLELSVDNKRDQGDIYLFPYIDDDYEQRCDITTRAEYIADKGHDHEFIEANTSKEFWICYKGDNSEDLNTRFWLSLGKNSSFEDIEATVLKECWNKAEHVEHIERVETDGNNGTFIVRGNKTLSDEEQKIFDEIMSSTDWGKNYYYDSNEHKVKKKPFK